MADDQEFLNDSTPNLGSLFLLKVKLNFSLSLDILGPLKLQKDTKAKRTS